MPFIADLRPKFDFGSCKAILRSGVGELIPNQLALIGMVAAMAFYPPPHNLPTTSPSDTEMSE